MFIQRTRPRTFSFELGAFQVAMVLDAVDLRHNLEEAFGSGIAVEEAISLTESNFIDVNVYEQCFVATLIYTGREYVLFDTGFGKPDSMLLEGLNDLGLAPADINVVVITHGHPDHIGGLRRAGKPVFVNARYVFGRTEFDYWTQGENIPKGRESTRDFFRSVCLPFADVAAFVEPGDTIAPGITAVDAAGHSAGLLAFIIESAGEEMLLWSDAFLHYVVSVQRPRWPAKLDDDKHLAILTRLRLLSLASERRMLVAGYHMPFPSLGYIGRSGVTFRWEPVSYQLAHGFPSQKRS